MRRHPRGSMFSTAATRPSGCRSRLPRPKEPEYSSGTSASVLYVARPGAARGSFAPVLNTLADGGANLAHQRQVAASGWSSRSSTTTPLLAFEQLAEEVAGERAEHEQVDHTDLQFARFAQVIDHRLGAGHHAALADDQVIGVLGAVAHDPVVAAAAECVELVEGLCASVPRCGRRRTAAAPPRSACRQSWFCTMPDIIGLSTSHSSGMRRRVSP